MVSELVLVPLNEPEAPKDNPFVRKTLKIRENAIFETSVGDPTAFERLAAPYTG